MVRAMETAAPAGPITRGPVRGAARADALPYVVFGALAAFVLASLAADVAGVNLGTRLPPFFPPLEPRIDPLAIIGVPSLLAAAAAARRLIEIRSSARFLVGAFALALLARVVLALAGRGLDGLYAIYGERGGNEYLPALPALRLGWATFLDRFAEIAPSLPIHPSAHPPGMLLLLSAAGIEGAVTMAAFTIVVGVAAVPLTYFLARELAGERAGRFAALLMAFSPAALIYGATSADALYATAGVAAAAALVSRRHALRAVGAPLAIIASFLAYSLLAVPAWAAVVVARRDGLGAGVRLALLCAGALVLFYAVLYALTGFDPLGALASANEAYRVGIATVRPYLYWLIGSPTAFLVAAGLPITWYATRALGAGDDAAIALLAVIATAAVLGFTKSETERIWLFLVPFACVAAARFLPERRLGPVLGLLCAQAIAIELLVDTAW